jgi:flagellar biosynthesis/type III secretory pathway protein FliH
MNMKSLSKLSSRVSDEQLKPWNIAELDVEKVDSLNEIDREQILALFKSGDAGRISERNSGTHSMLHRAGTHLILADWQPKEIDLQALQPSLEVEKEWLFVEEPNHLYEDLEGGVRKEEANFEKENVTSLKQARAQAEEILLEARTTADHLILQAQGGIEQAMKNGYQLGWDNARSEMQDALRAVHAMVDELQKWQADFMAQGEQTIIEMLKEISQTMFGEGVQLDANALQINLNRIMENSQRLGDLNIFLNPRDANLLDPSWKEYQYLISGNKVRVIPTEKITPGGCIVKGNTGMVDGRVETQLAAILNTFDEMRQVAQ